MPIYEYKREDGSTFEVMGKFSDPPLTADPETGQPVTRVFSPVSVHFKGSGFYNTDYGTAKRKRESDSSKKADAGSSAAKDSGGASSDSGSASSSSDSGSSSASTSSSGSSASGASAGSSSSGGASSSDSSAS